MVRRVPLNLRAVIGLLAMGAGVFVGAIVGASTSVEAQAPDGRIIVEKQTLPDGDPQQFDFSGDLNGTVGDGGMLSGDVAPGQYTVTEVNMAAGWTLTDISCDDGDSTGDVGTATATFNVEAGETVTCVFTDTKDGRIIVEKQTLPDGDPQQFDFSGDLNGTVGDGGMLSNGVAPGQYTVTEVNIPAGWTLASISCDDGNSTGDVGTATATFNVEAGETVTCVFTDTNLPTIVVQKRTLPALDPTAFTFTGAANGTLSDADSFATVVAVGQHQVTETVPAGWVLTSIVCDDADSTGDTNTGAATFDVSAGEVVTCVFTNTSDGQITVEKQTLPDGDPQQFDFSGAVAGQIPDGGSISMPVAPGQYSVTETVPAGWTLSDITCSDADSTGDTNTGAATFNVSAGENVTCVFTNTRDGQITVEKQTLPDGDPQQFDFSGAVAGQIPDGGSISLPVAPGQYSVTETVPAGWQLTSIVCDDNDSTGDTNTGAATFNVSAGENVTCVFTNTAEGSVTIVKDAIPADGTDFGFDGAFGPFTLDDDVDAALPDSVTFGGLLPGTYAVTETVPGGWQLSGLTCDDGSATALATATATIDLAIGEDVTCTFTNTAQATIIVEKQTVPDGSPQTFAFSGALSATLADGGTAAAVVAPGQHSVTETVPAGWQLTSIVCDDTDSSGDTNTGAAIFDVSAGETVTCTFTNTADTGAASLTLTKTPSASPVTVGGAVVYTFVATNSGTLPLSDVVISDPLPGLDPLACTWPGPSGQLLPAEAVSCAAAYVTAVADIPAITNTATVTGTIAACADPAPASPGACDVSATASATVLVVPPAGSGQPVAPFEPGLLLAAPATPTAAEAVPAAASAPSAAAPTIALTGRDHRQLASAGLSLAVGGFFVLLGARRLQAQQRDEDA